MNIVTKSISCLALLALVGCEGRFQSVYPETKRELVEHTPGRSRYVSIGRINDTSTLIFGRLKVINDATGKDITKGCTFAGLSNKYYRLGGSGPSAADSQDDSLFFSTTPESNVHEPTGLFAVHMRKGPVGLHPLGLHFEDTDMDGGTIECVGWNKKAELHFKSTVSRERSLTYIGDFVLTFRKGNAYDYEITDDMDTTYQDLLKVVPTADNKQLHVDKSIAERL